MFVLGNLLTAVAEVLDWVLVALQWIIIIRVVLSWVNPDPYNGIVRAIYAITEPVLAPFRRILPPWKLNGLDLSPIFVFLIILFLRIFLIRSLLQLATKL
ncbi:MAG TPA: YggT family protein [bacterium]